jgi:hypothetical protein
MVRYADDPGSVTVRVAAALDVSQSGLPHCQHADRSRGCLGRSTQDRDAFRLRQGVVGSYWRCPDVEEGDGKYAVCC